ncbi:MAG: hypothetical protein ACLPUO_23145 [Streptosporangiaceae bacterium]
MSDAGARLAVVGRNPARLASAARQIGDGVITVAADLSNSGGRAADERIAAARTGPDRRAVRQRRLLERT